MWKPTTIWRPGRGNTASGGFGVQCSNTGDLGYAKPRDVYQEKLAHELAKSIGVSVPEIRLGEVEGRGGLHAVSVVFGKECFDLRSARETSTITEPLKAALALASGLLALHGWLATGDLKEDHVLVTTDDDGTCCVAAIDFASAFAWGPDGGNIDGPTTEPKGLVENVDKAVVEATVRQIEAMTDDVIRQTVALIPDTILPQADRDRVANGLITRRARIRAAMRTRGWLP